MNRARWAINIGEIDTDKVWTVNCVRPIESLGRWRRRHPNLQRPPK